MRTIIIFKDELFNSVVGGDAPTSSSVEIDLGLSGDIITGATCTGVGLLGPNDICNGEGILNAVTDSAAELGQVFACSVAINIQQKDCHKHKHHHHHH